MLFNGIIAVYAENSTKPMKALCGENRELYNTKNVVQNVVMYESLRMQKNEFWQSYLAGAVPLLNNISPSSSPTSHDLPDNSS